MQTPMSPAAVSWAVVDSSKHIARAQNLKCPSALLHQCLLLSHRKAIQLQAGSTCNGREIKSLGTTLHNWETGVLIKIPGSVFNGDSVKAGLIKFLSRLHGETELCLLTVVIRSSKPRAGSCSFFSHVPHSSTLAPWNFFLSNLPVPNSFSQIVPLEKSK